MNPNFISSIKRDPDYEVQDLFKQAKKRKEEAMKFHLLSELLNGKIIDTQKNSQIFEALNKEKMDFETLLALHPEEVKDTIEYVNQRKLEQNGCWWNKDSTAKWGEKGAIPPCCYFARPVAYWKEKTLVNNFLNTFSKFRIAEGTL